MSMAGRMVSYARRRAGLTQRQLAAKAGIPQESIARIERGRVDPRVGTLDRTQFAGLLRASSSERLAVGIADDRTMIEFRRNLRRVAE